MTVDTIPHTVPVPSTGSPTAKESLTVIRALDPSARDDCVIDPGPHDVPARQVVILEDRGDSRTPLRLRGDDVTPGDRRLIERR